MPTPLKDIRIPTASELRMFLEDYAKPADAPVLEAFLQAARALCERASYRAMKADDHEERHCVRCHAAYCDEENSWNSCVIPHVFSADSTAEYGYSNLMSGKVYVYEALCCSGVRVAEDEGQSWEMANPAHKPCFEGMHTEKKAEVEYRTEDACDDVPYALPCDIQDGKCVRKCLTFDEKRPTLQYHW